MFCTCPLTQWCQIKVEHAITTLHLAQRFLGTTDHRKLISFMIRQTLQAPHKNPTNINCSTQSSSFPSRLRDLTTTDIDNSGYARSGECGELPVDANYNVLEIDHTFLGDRNGVVTYCQPHCSGAGDYTSAQRGTYCYQPPPGCAIGSLYVNFHLPYWCYHV